MHPGALSELFITWQYEIHELPYKWVTICGDDYAMTTFVPYGLYMNSCFNGNDGTGDNEQSTGFYLILIKSYVKVMVYAVFVSYWIVILKQKVSENPG